MAPMSCHGAPRALPLLCALLAALAAAPRRAAAQPAVLAAEASKSWPLADVPGCGGADIDAAMDTCRLEDNIKIADVHDYTFNVPEMDDPATAFGLLLTGKSIGGLVEMYLVGPERIYAYNPIFQLVGSIPGHTAMAEMFIRVAGAELVPGEWRLRITSKSADRKATLYSVRVQTPLTSTRLVRDEKAAIGTIALNCCNPVSAAQLGVTSSYLCSYVLPMAAREVTNATTDICQVGPFMCTSEGRLQKLMLGGAGLSCSRFPHVIAAFEKLHTLELEVATFGGSTYADAAQILAPLTALEFAYFRSTDLSGPIPCSLVNAHPFLKVLDISDTPASGQLPDCVMAHPAIEELILTRTAITGPLPDVIPSASHLRILYAWNIDPNTGKPWAGGGFSGPIPKSFANAQYLSDLVMPHHALEGPIPPLPDSVVWLDLKGNQITQMPDALPINVCVLDLSDNQITAALPDMSDNTLIWVNVSSNQIDGPLPSDFGTSVASLAVLDMSNNKISGDLDATNWDLPWAEVVNLADNDITGTLPADMATMPNLNYLNLAGNEISGTLDNFADALPEAPPQPDLPPPRIPPGPSKGGRRLAQYQQQQAPQQQQQFQQQYAQQQQAPPPRPQAPLITPAPEPEPELAPQPQQQQLQQQQQQQQYQRPPPQQQQQQVPPQQGYAQQDARPAGAGGVGVRAQLPEDAAPEDAPMAAAAPQQQYQPPPQRQYAPPQQQQAAAPRQQAAQQYPQYPQQGPPPQQPMPGPESFGLSRGAAAAGGDAPAAAMAAAPAGGAPGMANDRTEAEVNETPAAPPPPPPPYTGNKIIYLDVSNNRLEGSIPASLANLGAFHYIRDAPADHQGFHGVVLANNDLWTELPAFLLDQVSYADDANPCRCYLYLNLANNTRFCPTAATVSELSKTALASLTTDTSRNISCSKGDLSVVPLKAYLKNADGYLTAIPPPPPSKGITRSASAPPKAGGGGGGGGGGSAGKVAGAVIGVLAAVAIIGGLGWFVVRPRLQERRATGFFKSRGELDGAGGGLPPAGTAGTAGTPGGAPGHPMDLGWVRNGR
ncbi:MAG: hypothetical protein J3K34DRAFT_61406 [Monoraphidium minutum]|nr:MAG: hypothetical protein J3K34DRAFT_61406 [Monoraphidium minutum]